MKITAKGVIGKVTHKEVVGKVQHTDLSVDISGFTKSERLPADFIRTPTEEIASTEEFEVNLYLTKNETKIILENIDINVNKELIDTESATSVFSRVVNYVRSFGFDTYDAEDYFSEAYNKTSESVYASEVFLASLTKGFSDNAVFSEQIVFENSSVLLEEVNHAEIFSIEVSSDKYEEVTHSDSSFVFFDKSVTEVLDATDDVLGEATIDDDVYASFIKDIHDYHAATEIFITEVEYIRNTEDALSGLTDVISIEASPVLVQNATTSEVMTSSSQKILSSQKVVSEVVLKYIGTYFKEDYSSGGYAGTLV